MPSFKHIHSRETAIAHCPLSNSYFSAEPFRLREALDEGVKVGLGTDIAGGYSLDLMNSMRHAVSVSRMRQGSKQMKADSDDGKSLAIDWKESLYLATKGGATALGLATGAFGVGLSFDAQESEMHIIVLYCPLISPQFVCLIHKQEWEWVRLISSIWKYPVYRAMRRP